MSLLDSASLVVTPNGYKASKLYSIVPSDGSGDMTFARTGDTATRVNSSGLIETVLANKPRLDYTSGGCPKLLLEPQRTNLFTYSDQFNDASWTKNQATITANSVTSPDGTTNADNLLETATTDTHLVYKTFSATSGTDYSVSVFVKANGRNFAYIYFLAAAGTFVDSKAWFDLSSGTIGTTNSGITSTITNFGNGWFRITAKRSASATNTGYVAIGCSNADNVVSYAGDITKGIYLYGAQAEASAYATSYIPTTTASVTRNADIGANKSSGSSLIGQTSGTMFLDFNKGEDVSNASAILFGIFDSTPDNNRIQLVTRGNYITTYIVTNSIAYAANPNLILLSAATRFKVAVTYSSAGIVIYINGNLVYTNTNLFVFSSTIETISIGSRATLDSYGKGERINYVALWKTRLSNNDLAALTSL